MGISFSTTIKGVAKKYLEDSKYSYFNEEAKKFILENVGEGVLRVQDPFMYPNPKVEITSKEVYDKIKSAM